tara:strand:- start:1498 stop:2352 length:855 start_codon:yes stop_codon:yes gene_type:complete
MGKVVGATIQCGYHGLRFDKTGSCIEVPGQKHIPPGASIHSYPAVERYSCVWIWMGSEQKADPNLIPNIFWRDDPNWVVWDGWQEVGCSYDLLVDIQLDNTHAPFVHPDTIGSGAIIDSLPVVERDEESVRAKRWMMNVIPSPTFERAIGTSEKVDRWLIWEFKPPSFCSFDIGCALAGTGAERGDRSKGVTLRTVHFMTPKTETSCYYFWSVGRNFKLNNQKVTKEMAVEFAKIFAEDIHIVEAQQMAIGVAKNGQKIDVNSDAPVMQAHKLIERKLTEEENK